MHYRAPLADIRFCLDKMVGIDALRQTGRCPELEDGTGDAILDEAAHLFESRVSPAHADADREGARLENGVVRTPRSFHDAYRSLAAGGWTGLSASTRFGGAGMRMAVVTPCNEMLGSACLSLSLNPLLTQGVILALERHASEELQARYLPRLASGEWSGTMNLTEPHAGSDVGALTTEAAANPDGSWSITGQKIYISWGDSDLTRNIVHLVLARTPGAPSGTRGISLFLVPKVLPDGGAHNRVRTLSLERKMGLHGSPTAALAYEQAQGWLVGEECAGMKCMFTMMNAARLGVGLQGVAIAEGARQLAARYASERRQGRTANEDPSILGHADVRRMALEMRAWTEAARAICYDLAVNIDLSDAAPDAGGRAAAARRAALLTPIAKAFGADVGIRVASLGIQMHGGAGYIEDTGAARWYRDARIAAIYEGTNGIQAMDLVGRRLAPDSGDEALRFLGECRETAAALQAAGSRHGRWGARLARSVDCATDALSKLVEAVPTDRAAGATACLDMLATVRGAHHLGKGALAAPSDSVRLATAAVYFERMLPMADAHAEIAGAGAAALYEIPRDRIAP